MNNGDGNTKKSSVAFDKVRVFSLKNVKFHTLLFYKFCTKGSWLLTIFVKSTRSSDFRHIS
jgi:hypothetical protein